MNLGTANKTERAHHMQDRKTCWNAPSKSRQLSNNVKKPLMTPKARNDANHCCAHKLVWCGTWATSLLGRRAAPKRLCLKALGLRSCSEGKMDEVRWIRNLSCWQGSLSFLVLEIFQDRLATKTVLFDGFRPHPLGCGLGGRND